MADSSATVEEMFEPMQVPKRIWDTLKVDTTARWASVWASYSIDLRRKIMAMAKCQAYPEITLCWTAIHPIDRKAIFKVVRTIHAMHKAMNLDRNYAMIAAIEWEEV